MGGELEGAAAGAEASATEIDSSNTTTSGSNNAVVHVRCSNCHKFTVEVDLGATVLAMKGLLVERSEIPADQQRLIYKGRVLKDDNLLSSYGLQNDHAVHLVRGAPPPSAPAPTAAPVSATTPAAGNPARLGSVPGVGGRAVPPFGVGQSEFQQVQQQLMQFPNMMREMLNMPAVQNIMNNPELMRSLIMSNPQMREIIDRNPDLAHILSDPSTLRQTMDASRSPELMREMMRNTDRAMSNIEAMPEGFNMLRRMYERVQEPLLNAATMRREGGNDMASSPFASSLGVNSVAQGGANNTGAGTTVPNTAPLPNPWNPTPARAGTGAGQARAAVPGAGAAAGDGLPDLGGLAGLGMPDLRTPGGGGGPTNPAMMQMLQHPRVQQTMQNLLSNPAYMNQIMNMQPQLRSMLNENPQMMQNPDFIRQMSSPETLRDLLQHQQIMMGLRGRQAPRQNPGQGVGGTGGVPGLNMDALITLFEGLGGLAPSNPDVPPEQQYASQLSQLHEMGFIDTQENIRALTAVGGNVHAAVERLLGNLG